ncbi:MAG: hypothetical protein SXV54_00265 [Chloroflexota bacterium]|nr:hypothetical protein [Chloroflexota bacterium]
MTRNSQIGCILATVSTVVLTTAYAILCCMIAWLGMSLVDESDDVRNRQTLVRTEVTIDTSSLPENPTVKEWYPLSVQVLQDNGWNLSPNLTSLGTIVSCEPNPVLDKVTMDFVDDYFDGFRPSLNVTGQIV